MLINKKVSGDKRFFKSLETGHYDFSDIKLSDYGTYGEKHMLCPFCDEMNDARNPLHLYEVLEDGSVVDQVVFLCEDHEELYRAHVNKKGKRHINTSSVKNPRIRKYLKTETLPDDVSAYAWGNELHHLCVFCSQPYGSKYLRMPIEHGISDTLLSWAGVCHECNHVIEEHENLYKGDTHVTSDICKQCWEYYPITVMENNTRIMNNSLGEHYCQSCLDEFNLTNRDRFVNIQCEECDNTTWLDRTRFPDLNTYTCHLHGLDVEMNDELDFVLPFGDQEELSIHISASDIDGILYWDYHIFITESKVDLLFSGDTDFYGFETAEDCAYQAATEAHKFLAQISKQISLFE